MGEAEAIGDGQGDRAEGNLIGGYFPLSKGVDEGTELVLKSGFEVVNASHGEGVELLPR
jgi:hypothetical protein